MFDSLTKTVQREDPKLTSSHTPTNTTSIYKAAISKKDWNLTDIIFYKQGYKEGIKARQGETQLQCI